MTKDTNQFRATVYVCLFSLVSFTCVYAADSSTRRLEYEDLLRTKRGKGLAADKTRVFRTEDGYLRFIGAPALTDFAVDKVGTPQQIADEFLKQRKNLFVSESNFVSFEVSRVKTNNGRGFVRYKQKYSDLPVEGAAMIIQISKAGGIEAIISDIMRDTEWLDKGKVPLAPTISAQTARQKAIEHIAAQYLNLQLEATDAELTIYSPQVVGNSGPPQLTWQMVVNNVGKITVKERILIDAHSGKVAHSYPLIHTSIYREIWDYENLPFSPELVREEGDPATDIDDVDLAYDYLGDVYDFYYTHHNRLSYDDEDSDAVAYVRIIGQSWYGAAAYQTYTAYYEGFVADDVVGHEFTHCVTMDESDLTYSGESGAINESLSDMWGEWIDQTNGDGNDLPVAKWFLGEDVIDPIYGNGAIRYMKDPGYFNNPSIYEGEYWDEDSDVHSRSGVGNKLSYLLTDGDTFNGQTVTGMGISGAADLFYECQVNILLPNSDYYDLYYALIQAAINLGLSWNARVNIKEACEAVEICPDTDDWALVAHWKLDETEGGSAEDSAGDNDGTLAGDPTWTPSGGQIDGALDFDGDDHVSLDPVGALEGSTATISAWIKAENLTDSSSDWRPILTQYYYNGGHSGYYLYIQGNKPGLFLGGYGSSHLKAVSPNAIDSDTWYHIAGTYDNENLKIYVDGELKDTYYLPDSTGYNCTAYIGYDNYYYDYFEGLIDDVRVYNWAMTRDEILDIIFEDAEKFALQNDAGYKVAWFDDRGNLFLNGSFTPLATPSATANDEFIFKDSGDDIIALIDRTTGNMEITGTLSEEQSSLSPGTDDFVIKDNGGNPVSYISNTNGNIYLKGKMYGGSSP